jgi:hypothetical protein
MSANPFYASTLFVAPNGESFTAGATISWDSSYYVTVTNLWCELPDSEWTWRLTGSYSAGDSTTYASESKGVYRFQGEEGKTYVWGACAASGNSPAGTWTNNNGVFTLTDDSSSGGSSGGSGGGSGWMDGWLGANPEQALIYNLLQDGNLHIMHDEGIESIIVKRVSSNSLPCGELYDGDDIEYGDQFSITVVPCAGYEPVYYTLDDVQVPFHGSNLDLVSNSEQELFGIDWDALGVLIYATSTIKEYMLSMSFELGASLTVKRIASGSDNAYLGAIGNKTKLYYGDTLEITATASSGFDIGDFNIYGCVQNADGTYKVVSDVVVTLSTTSSGSETGFTSCTIYIDNGTTWVKCMPYLDNGSA